MLIQALSRSQVNEVTCHLYSYDAMKWKDICHYKCTNCFQVWTSENALHQMRGLMSCPADVPDFPQDNKFLRRYIR